ncbi:MAG: DUF1552 domain-containing protein [Bryobacterales bacterium]|nr:DUF1552 domain-containing protein [Bryobacterales bacterium]
MSGKHLHRRTFLRGLGTAVALPFLDSMMPASGASRARAQPAPLRMAFVYVPNGVHMADWTPAGEGADFELPFILEPVAPFRRDFLLISGLTHNGGRALGDGPGDHARAAASFLTGVHPRKTAGADIRNGISADQVAAQATGNRTMFASLELGCEDGRQVGSCDSGYSCAYSNSISWRTPSNPLPPEINPRLVFERLFAAYDGESAAARAKRVLYKKSILDFVAGDTEQLKAQLGPTDRRKLDEYLFGIRDIEKRIEAAEQSAASRGPAPAQLPGKPAGIPVDYAEHSRLMFDLMAVAFQTDLTRIITFMMAREGSGRSYREIGISDAHHPLTHHRNNPEMIDKVRRINRYHMEQFAWFLNRLKSVSDGDGTLLDHSIIVYGSGLSDGNRHRHENLPVLVAGRGGGTLHPGRHLRFPIETPMANLYMSILERAGVEPESIGDSNGKLQELSEL